MNITFDKTKQTRKVRSISTNSPCKIQQLQHLQQEFTSLAEHYNYSFPIQSVRSINRKTPIKSHRRTAVLTEINSTENWFRVFLYAEWKISFQRDPLFHWRFLRYNTFPYSFYTIVNKQMDSLLGWDRPTNFETEQDCQRSIEILI